MIQRNGNISHALVLEDLILLKLPGFSGGAVAKNPPANSGDMGSSPGPG